MRLSNNEIKTIRSVVCKFDKNAKIRLYGSRVDNNKRGGDIDLLIFSGKLGFKENLKIKAKLKELLGDQKIDIIIARDRSNPFVDLVYYESVGIN